MSDQGFSQHLFLETFTADGFSKIGDFLDKQRDAQSLLILAAGLSEAERSLLNDYCPKFPLPIWGAIFPKIYTNSESHTRGIAFIPLPYAVKTVSFNIKENNFSHRLEETFFPREMTNSTLFIFFDRASQRDDAWFETVYNYYGTECHYLGGGTGASELPSLISSEGLHQNGMLLAMLSGQGVIQKRHGWESYSGPFQVTQMQHNILMELDWRPLSEVLQEQERGKGERFSDSPEIQQFVFGISKIGGEKLLRTGLYDAAGGQVKLHFPLPAGNFVYLMQANQETMEAAAPLALLKAEDELKPTRPRFSIFFDCELRQQRLPVGHLKQLFAEKSGFGIICDGQIACSGSDYPELLESTFCIGLIP